MKKSIFSIILSIILFSSLQCTTIYYAQRIHQKNENWEFQINSIEKGPRSFIYGALKYFPKENYTYITTKISIKNLSSTQSELNLTKVFLVSENIISSPQFISMRKIILLPAPKLAKVNPNEVIYREFIHIFPENKTPEILVVDQETTIPIVQQNKNI